MNLQKELDAQRKRVEAIKYLQSQGEIVTGNVASYIRASKDESKTDNTLEILRKQQVSDNQKNRKVENEFKAALLQQKTEVPDVKKESFELSSSNTNLPHGWIAVLDKTTNKYYYWNKTTNITTWEKPSVPLDVQIPLDSTSTSNPNLKVLEVLEDGDWIQKTHQASQQLYWQNKITGEKCFEKDKPKSVIKSVSSSSSKEKLNSSKAEMTSEEKLNEKRRKVEVDPLDFTGGKVSFHLSWLPCLYYFLMAFFFNICLHLLVFVFIGTR